MNELYCHQIPILAAEEHESFIAGTSVQNVLLSAWDVRSGNSQQKAFWWNVWAFWWNVWGIYCVEHYKSLNYQTSDCPGWVLINLGRVWRKELEHSNKTREMETGESRFSIVRSAPDQLKGIFGERMQPDLEVLKAGITLGLRWRAWGLACWAKTQKGHWCFGSSLRSLLNFHHREEKVANIPLKGGEFTPQA